MTEQELWLRELARQALLQIITRDYPEAVFALNARNFQAKPSRICPKDICQLTVRFRGRKHHFFELTAKVSFPLPELTDERIEVSILITSYTPPDPTLPKSFPNRSYAIDLRLDHELRNAEAVGAKT